MSMAADPAATEESVDYVRGKREVRQSRFNVILRPSCMSSQHDGAWVLGVLVQDTSYPGL